MAFRTPRGYDVNRTPYQEISEGVRPPASMVPMEAWTGLPPVRIDELAHDPIVLDAGTFVGVATGGMAEGKVFPAFYHTGLATLHSIDLKHHSDGATWGLPTTGYSHTLDSIVGSNYVRPLGVVYQPIYSFNLQAAFTNYKRNENLGILTDYMIQIPATTASQRGLKAGDLVQVAKILDGETFEYGLKSSLTAGAITAGELDAWDGTAVGMEYVVGRVFNNINFASGTAVLNTKLVDDYSATSLTTAGEEEFKGLSRVQTVPGLAVAGSGTAGTPGWLANAESDALGAYHALTILVRL
jgi:hypothetical protein